MVKISIILLFVVLIMIVGCNPLILFPSTYKIPKNGILPAKAQYTFTKPSTIDLKKIDTTAYYVQVFEGRYYNDDEKKNPRILIFHNDGYFKIESLLYFGKYDNERDKNSIYYGGKWRVINRSSI